MVAPYLLGFRLIRFISRTDDPHPIADFVFLELPATAHAVGRHRMLVDPAVNGATADTELLAYLGY